MMKPILFNTEMVKAILDGRKTVTRRKVKSKVIDDYCDYDDYVTSVAPKGLPCIRTSEKEYYMIHAPYEVGDVLYVRETWYPCINEYGEVCGYDYKEKLYPQFHEGMRWKPSIHMPKEAARILLKVTDVRVEQLQDVDEEQAEREGVRFEPATCELGARKLFQVLWNSTIKKLDLHEFGWEANPWVWVIEFERCEKEVG